MKKIYQQIKQLKNFLILWSTQSFSMLGSSMTSFALVIWIYQEKGSALTTALLTICSYAPYVIMSILAGAMSDKWNKKITILISDSVAAICSVTILILLQMGQLEIWHLYCLNAINGLMNSIQQPASDVAISIVASKEHYQKVSGLQSLSNSVVTILSPAMATAILAIGEIKAVIAFDLITFSVAFMSMIFVIKIPTMKRDSGPQEPILRLAASGLSYLKKNQGIMGLILFLASINFIASIHNAALPAMILSKTTDGEQALAILNVMNGVAMLVGSLVASLAPPPKNRVRVICNILLLSMGTDNFILAFGSTIPVWCIGGILGWIGIPIMNTNMNVLFRNYIPIEMQGRVYSARNTLQYFTIPLGYFVGGVLVDKVFEPFMAMQQADSLWRMCFGTGKGSGAAMLYMVLGFAGVMVCLFFRKNKEIWKIEKN